MKNTKLLYISLGILAVILLLGGAWFIYSQINLSQPSQDGPDAPGFSFGDTTQPSDRPGPQFDRGNPSFGTSTRNDLLQPKVWKVTDGPVAASTAFETTEFSNDNSSQWFIRYIERTTGHVYEHEVVERKNIRLANTTVPRIQYAKWMPSNPDYLVFQYLDSTLAAIQTFYAQIAPRATNDEQATSRENAYRLDGEFLAQNIQAFAVSPSSNELFYLTRTSNGSQGALQSFGGSPRIVYRSPLRELLPYWGAASSILLTTKAHSSVPGYAYIVSPASQNERLALANKQGLTAQLSPDASQIIYTELFEGGATMWKQDLGGGNRQLVSLATYPQKCVWSRINDAVLYCAVPNRIPRGDMPESWYQGTESFADFIWRINTETLSTTVLADYNTFAELGAQEGIDGINLAIDEFDEYLTIQNKKDGSLWAIRLNDPVLRNDNTVQ